MAIPVFGPLSRVRHQAHGIDENCFQRFQSSLKNLKIFHVRLVFAHCLTLFPMALRECRVTFRDVRDIDHSVTVHAETTMDAAALGLKRIREQKFVMEDLADPVTVELVTSTQHKASLKR